MNSDRRKTNAHCDCYSEAAVVWKSALSGKPDETSAPLFYHPPKTGRRSISKSGCGNRADSRVSPEIIFDQGLGDLFVVRVAGNIASFSVIGSLELAVDSFKIPLILNLGHTLCGAVESAMDRTPVPEVLAELLEYIEPAVLKMEHHNETDLNLAVEFNVHEQSRRILERSQLIRNAVEAGQTRLVSAIYEVETGLVRVI